eukprot:3131175-Rhodomonas_salina.1
MFEVVTDSCASRGNANSALDCCNRPDIEQRFPQRTEPVSDLVRATINRDIRALNHILSQPGVSVDAPDSRGRTALHFAAQVKRICYPCAQARMRREHGYPAAAWLQPTYQGIGRENCAAVASLRSSCPISGHDRWYAPSRLLKFQSVHKQPQPGQLADLHARSLSGYPELTWQFVQPGSGNGFNSGAQAPRVGGAVPLSAVSNEMVSHGWRSQSLTPTQNKVMKRSLRESRWLPWALLLDPRI